MFRLHGEVAVVALALQHEGHKFKRSLFSPFGDFDLQK